MNKAISGLTTALLFSAFLTACDNGSAPPREDPTEPMPQNGTVATEPEPEAGWIEDVVQTQWGAVRGEMTTDDLLGVSARIFRGLPYAAPPVGDLRWRAPQPAES